MVKFQPLSKKLFRQLKKIEPSIDGNLTYYPCRVYINGGDILDKVYIVEQNSYFKAWGVYPEDDEGKKEVKIESVIKIEESPTRIPVRFANKLYQAGESGMGYCFFTVVFKDGQEKAYLSGNAIDFFNYPKGKGPKDIIDVIPHKGRDSDYEETPEYYWCIYSGVK